MLPSTATKGANRRWPVYVLAAAALVALVLFVEAFIRAANFSPGEEILSPNIRDVVVSAEDGLYPPPDVGRFTERPDAVFVYLSVEGLPDGEEAMEARVRRAESGSAFFLLFGGGTGIQVLDEQEDQLSGGASGILKFAVETGSGEPVPPGNYTVEIHDPGGPDGEDEPAARKFFVVEG